MGQIKLGNTTQVWLSWMGGSDINKPHVGAFCKTGGEVISKGDHFGSDNTTQKNEELLIPRSF